ncbi:YiiX/YebB-like N1pC/P60 family cysteine hydrolase [Luteolibacter marinus]|uniref:YiiX/YebB-like N1pC/P60 family cysteine hydrolase n=1 Tax=Luteolibacter marinus TaxID=2776705 RepID=UPI0018684869|nr:YiiX/YebB-like N1pC/P60 family cysteine hydrolase [Luteolibacter marinus]
MNGTSDSDHDPRIRRGCRAVLGAAGPARAAIEVPFLGDASGRGYFTPDEDESVRTRYARFLGTRAALLSTLASLEAACAPAAGGWERRLPAFTVAFAAACLLLQQARELVSLAAAHPLLARKLDEPSPVHGIPRKTFARLFRTTTDPLRLMEFREATAFYEKHRSEIAGLECGDEFAAVVCFLESGHPWLGHRGRDIVVRRAEYGWFSFLRRHRSAWKKSVFGFFEVSGRMIAELRQPGVKAPGMPKRVGAGLRERALKLARPGDVFVTRHDDALSNLFLPGYWPHAALFIGNEAQRHTLGVEMPPGIARRARDPLVFLESKKDGVRFRPADETLEVDAFVILRPPLDRGQLAATLAEAMRHEGKLYDFSFDFRNADRLACTEVVYRTYHGAGAIAYSLVEAGGRLCLPAEELIAQSLQHGFRVVAACGIGKNAIVTGTRAELQLHASRSAL